MDLLHNLSQAGKLCSGCGACYNICPRQAIEMQPNPQGFLYPVIGENCVDCGLCENVCPKLHPQHDHIPEPECFAARADDDTRSKSSSGGMFTLFANWVFAQGGVVCGAAMETDYSVHHVCIDNPSELYRLQKSKYLQSNTEHVYQEAVTYLKQGRVVLFTGTPCQVAAMRNFVKVKKVDDSKLYRVDILCHGVPSQQMWQDYVKENFDLQKVETIEFRSKVNGWRADQVHVFWKDTSVTSIPWAESAYIEGFLRNIILRDGCGDCEFCTHRRQGDVTIGDFWEVHKHKPYLNDGKGTSAVTINSEKGRQLFEAVSSEISYEQTPLEAAAKYNRMMSEYLFHPAHERFKTLYPGHRFTDAVMQCRHTMYDIGLVGPYTTPNYGSQLTYFALYKALTDMGYSVYMIERPSNSRIPANMSDLNMFAQNPYPKYALSKIFPNIAEMKFLNAQCHTFIMGSDQILNHNAYVLYAKYMVMNFVSDNHRKIAYAASWGHDSIWGAESDRAEESYFLKKFDKFSVREETAVDLAKQEFGVDAQWVLDPVFICDPEVFHEMAQRGDHLSESRYIFNYFLNTPAGLEEKLNTYADGENLNIHTILGKTPRESFSISMQNWSVKEDAHLEDWLAEIKDSQLVLCDSFHGVCFSLIFKRQFLVLVDKLSGEARLKSILKKCGLEDHMVYSSQQLAERLYTLMPIDYDRVDEILNAERELSLKWLRDAIETDKNERKPLSEFDIVDGRCDDLARQICDNKAAANNRSEDLAHQIADQRSYAENRSEDLARQIADQRNYAEDRNNELLRQILDMQNHLNQVQADFEAYRQRGFFRWIVRKTRGGIRCVKDNGMKYTWIHFWKKVANKLGKNK